MKRPKFAPFLALILLFAAVPSRAAEPAAADDDLASDLPTFLEKYCAANGGRENLLSIRSLRMEATLTMVNGTKGGMIYISQLPGYMRSVWSGPRGETVRRGFNGVISWELRTRPDGSEVGSIGTSVPGPVFDWVLANPAAVGAELEFLPVERSDRSEAYHVRARYADGRLKDYYLNTVTLAESKVVETAIDGTVRTVVIDKSMKRNGIWFPQVQREMDASGAEVLSIEVSDVQLNIGLLPVFFDPPKKLLDPVPGR